MSEFESIGAKIEKMGKRPFRVGVVQSLFRSELTHQMVSVVNARARVLGASIVCHVLARGVLETPLLAKRLLANKDVDAVVVLGVVIKGATDHDRVVVDHATSALIGLSLHLGKPVGIGIMGPGVTLEQARGRVVEYATGSLDAVACTLQQEI